MDGFTGGGIFRGKQVSVIDLPREARDVVGDELPLTFGTGKIEGLIRQAEERGGSIELGLPAAAEPALMMTHEVGRYQPATRRWRTAGEAQRRADDFRHLCRRLRDPTLSPAWTAPPQPILPENQSYLERPQAQGSRQKAAATFRIGMIMERAECG